MLQLPYRIILASKSPRRQELLSHIIKEFDIKTKDTEEVYPSNIKVEDVPEYLALLKAKAFEKELSAKEVVISADTIVTLNGNIYGKPTDERDAIKILQELSGKMHQVITGVALFGLHKQITFKSITHVYFKKLSIAEINYYIKTYQPYDKAGAYAIQEWIGMVGIEKIEGDYFNVVGLPINKLYQALQTF